MAYGDNVLIRDFSTRILRGDRIGLIGPNGAGKTTLLKLILGEIEPDAGTVRRGSNLSVAYFDQLRAVLDPEASVQDTISPGSEWVEIGSTRKHIVSYLNDFLFAPERARPANVLVLDEPTNDLDIETLELLEALLQDYTGTVFLVSHDRAFLDNVVTEVIAFEGNGVLREHVGGYSDWAAYQARAATADKRADTPAVGARAAVRNDDGGRSGAAAKATPQRLTLGEQNELAALPARIETLETRIAGVHQRFADPSLYQNPARDSKALKAELADAERELAGAYVRWEALEARKDTDR